jgi:hypothetical protein
MKKCKKCNENKNLDMFYAHAGMKDGRLNICIVCKKTYEKDYKNYVEYDKTEKGVIRIIYKSQRFNSKQRGHSHPDYTKEQLSSWLYANGFKLIYEEWVLSSYKKDMKPSVDRINDFDGYSLNNIQLTTWKKNREKQYNDTLTAKSTSGLKCKEVKQFSLNDGSLINIFISESEAGRALGISKQNISACCLGKRQNAGGYIFTF